MATVMIVLLVVGYAWSTWLLRRQEHFDYTARRPRQHHWGFRAHAGTRHLHT